MSGIEWCDLDLAADGGEQEQPAQAAPLRRSVVLLALVAAVAALLAAGLAWRLRSGTVVHTLVRTPAAYRGVAADGCPVGDSCRATTTALPALRAAAEQEFPDADLTAGSTVYDAEGRPVFSSVSLRDPSGVVLLLSAQCVPGDRDVPSTAPPSTGVGPADISQVTAGEPGCSVAVAAHVPAGIAIPASQIAVLAIDRDLQLSPH